MFTEICGRIYIGGVFEIFPVEVGNIMLPVIDKMYDDKLKNELLEYIDSIVRSGEDIEKDICILCHKIWKICRNVDLG